MKCQRGDLSFIFNGNAVPSESFVVLDNEQKVYQRIHHEVCESDGERRARRLLLQASHIRGSCPASVYFLFIPANQDSLVYCQPLPSTSWRGWRCLFSINNTLLTLGFSCSPNLYKYTCSHLVVLNTDLKLLLVLQANKSTRVLVARKVGPTIMEFCVEKIMQTINIYPSDENFNRKKN